MSGTIPSQDVVLKHRAIYQRDLLKTIFSYQKHFLVVQKIKADIIDGGKKIDNSGNWQRYSIIRHSQFQGRIVFFIRI